MITTDRRRSWLAAIAIAILLPRAAEADDHDRDRAEQLFQQARDLMGRNDFATACPILEASYALDRGGGTLLALALCYEGANRPASALREYREALSQALAANRPDRVMLAESHVQALEASVPRITIHLAQPEPAGVAVTLDRAPLDRAAFVAGAPVDPGKHDVEASAPGTIAWRATIDVPAAPGATAVEVPVLASLIAPPVIAVAPPRSTTPRTLGTVIGTAGLLSIGVGSYFGVEAFHAETRSKQSCTGTSCSPDGVRFNHDARSDALVSDVAIGVGGAALITGIVLVVRWYVKPDAKLQAWSDGDSLGFSTSW